MKKLLGIVVLGLLWCSVGFAECIKGNCNYGKGTFIFPNGDKYIGEFKYHTQNGQGTYTWIKGDKYVGYYKDGKRHGQGTITYADGRK